MTGPRDPGLEARRLRSPQRRRASVSGAARIGIAVLCAAAMSPLVAAAPATATPVNAVSAPVAAASPVTRTPGPAGPVQVAVSGVAPLVPADTDTNALLTISVSLTNTSDEPVTDVTVTAERGDPIGNQTALEESVTDAGARTGGIPVTGLPAAPLTIAPHATVRTTFRTTTSRQTQTDPGLCLCATASVYPLDLSATGTVGGATSVLGGVRTYVPSFDATPPAKVDVTWVWPLIDRPHRTADGSVFTDDALAASVGSGGRLDRALQVVERVAPAVPLTLVIDPELLDELQVMTGSSYTVQTGSAKAVAGTGRSAATLWLTRLQTVLAQHPDVSVQLTPLADPDVTGLSQHSRTWSTALPATISKDVAAALGRSVPASTFAWPAQASVTPVTLDALSAAGVQDVLVDGSQVRPSSTDGIPVSSAVLPASTGTITALTTAPVLQGLVAAAVTGRTATLPRLMSELAVRAAQRPQAPGAAILSAPRYVDPSPTAAAQTILATSSSVFSTPVSVASAAGAVGATASNATLAATQPSPYSVSDDLLDAAGSAADHLRAATSLIDNSTAGQQVLAPLPDQLQRTESSAWSPAGQAIGGGTAAGSRQHATLRSVLSSYLGGVRILPPSSGSYTLASSSAPLPISVRNDLKYSVQVTLQVGTIGGLTGFSARDTAVQTIAPNSKATIRVSTRIERSGRIPVQALLRTPNDYPLGAPVSLSVHSTALGTIGVIITVVSGVVLVLALLVRFVHRIRRRRRKGRTRTGHRPATPPARAQPETVP